MGLSFGGRFLLEGTQVGQGLGLDHRGQHDEAYKVGEGHEGVEDVGQGPDQIQLHGRAQPLFIDEGEVIQIDTRTGEYMGRA